MNVIRSAPCYALIVPTDVVDPGEVLGGFRRFYRTFLKESDLGRAVDQLMRERLSNGYWVGETAEKWYEKIIMHYLKTYATRRAMEERARDMRKIMQAKGFKPSVGKMKRVLNTENKYYVREKVFRIFFSTESIPGNGARFESVRNRVARKAEKLMAGPKY